MRSSDISSERNYFKGYVKSGGHVMCLCEKAGVFGSSKVVIFYSYPENIKNYRVQ